MNCSIVCADWKENPDSVFEDTIKAVNKILKKNPLCRKVYKYQHPLFEGSDMYGWLLSDQKLSKKDIKEMIKNDFPELEEEENEQS